MRISDGSSDVCSSDLRSRWQMLYGQRPSDLTVTQASITGAAISIRMIRPLKPSAYWLQRPGANNKTYWGRQSATLWRSMMRELNSGHDKTHPRSHAGTASAMDYVRVAFCTSLERQHPHS